MQIAVISASNKQPEWVRSGFDSYARRMRGACTLDLTEVPLPRRTRSADTNRLRQEEGQRMLTALPKSAHVVALDESGRQWTTVDLRNRLERWLGAGQPVALLIGGPDGLADECLARADESWCLSPLTLPHGLVRVIVAEALYRAFSLLRNHPYHRE